MQVAAQLTINVIPHISAGSPAPAACRRVITVVGISCRLALSSASSIASADIPVSPREASFFAASIPAGVAALPSPSRFAARFIDMAFQAASSVNPGNSGLAILRNSLPNFATSPAALRISIRPLQSVIVASSVISSETACSPLESSASAVSPALPVSKESAAEPSIKTIQILPILHPSVTFKNGYLLNIVTFIGLLSFFQKFMYHFIIYFLTSSVESGRMLSSAVVFGRYPPH